MEERGFQLARASGNTALRLRQRWPKAEPHTGADV
jgi:hypothetical protein